MRNSFIRVSHLSWLASSFLVASLIYVMATNDQTKIVLASVSSLLLTFIASRRERIQKILMRKRESLLDFYSGLSLNFSTGLGQENSYLRQVPSDSSALKADSRRVLFNLARGKRIESTLKRSSKSRQGLDKRLPEIFSELLSSGTAGISVASDILNLWTENVAISSDEDRLMGETSARVQFLYYLNSFSFGFLAASSKLLARLSSPFLVMSHQPSVSTIPVSLFLFHSTVFLLISRKFLLARQVPKFVLSSAIFWGTFIVFEHLMNL